MINKISNFYTRPLVQDTVKTTIWSTAGKAVGFLIPFFIAAWFGVSKETDAFFFAYGLILFFSAIFAPVVENAVVPYIAEARTKDEDIGKFVGNILSVSSIGLIVLAGIILLIIKPVLSVVTRFNAEGLNLVYRILLMTSPLVVLLFLTSILAGTLNTYKKFIFPAVTPALRAVVVLICVFTFKERLGVYAIALGYLIGEVARLIALLLVVKRIADFKLKLSMELPSRIREFFKTNSYQVIGMSAVGLNPIIDRVMASWLGEGSVSVLYYADRLYMIPVSFMCAGLFPVILSHWSGRYYELGFQRLNKDVNKTLKIVGFVSLTIMVSLIFFHQPLVRLAFGRGAFAQEKLLEVGWAWICYLLGFSFYVMWAIYARAYLILKKTKVLMRCAIYLVLLNIFFNYVLMKYFKVYGIALSTSIVAMFAFFYLKNTFSKIVLQKNEF